MTTPPTILILPGLGGSGLEHWQSIWEGASASARRVQQASWAAPRLTDWMATLERELVAAPEPVVLAAHSLACALVAHLAQRFDHASPKIRAALLVAPADVDAEAHTPPQTRSFAPMPMLPLPFASILVASRDDPYVTFERATAFARAWGSQLFDAGAAGHINAASGFGAWPSGRALLDQLIARTS